jgi:hypothetical protein
VIVRSQNCLHGRESPGSKELKRVNLNILPNSAFGCPTHDLHGFSLHCLASLPASKCRRLWDDALGETDSSRLMISDILLQRHKERWVLDAKYKCDFTNEGRSDRFQMCAYAIGFHASRATLVYTLQIARANKLRTLLRTKIGGSNVFVDSIALSMASGPHECRQSLETFLLDQVSFCKANPS